MENKKIRELSPDEMNQGNGGHIPPPSDGNGGNGGDVFRYREKFLPGTCKKCHGPSVNLYIDNILIRIDCPKCGSYTP